MGHGIKMGQVVKSSGSCLPRQSCYLVQEVETGIKWFAPALNSPVMLVRHWRFVLLFIHYSFIIYS